VEDRDRLFWACHTFLMAILAFSQGQSRVPGVSLMSRSGH
jgi:hypothetical protein